MGVGSFLGIGGGAAKPSMGPVGFDKWKKQGKKSFTEELRRSGITLRDQKKAREGNAGTMLKKGKVSQEKIVNELKREYGYKFGTRVKKALAPKDIAKQPSLHELADMEKKQQKRININLGEARLRRAQEEAVYSEEEEYKKYKGAAREGEQEHLTLDQEEFEKSVGQFAGGKTDQHQDSREDKTSNFRGIGSTSNKPHSIPPGTTAKTPPTKPPIMPI